MSYNNVTLGNPGINEGSQLARRKADGIEDIYFTHTSGTITQSDDHPDQVDLTDEVTRRVDPTKLPLDPIAEHESYKLVDGKNYRVRYEDVGGGNRVPYLQEVISRGQYSDTKMALIGGKVYEIEFEKDPETKRISTYLTTPVGDLFQNDKFLQGQNPAQKLELLGKIRKSATFVTWYDSGEYNRYHRKKYDGEENPELDPAKVRSYDFDDATAKLEGDLKKQVGVPAKLPLPTELSEVDMATAAAMGAIMGVALYAGSFATKKAAATALPEAGSKIVKPQGWNRVRPNRLHANSSGLRSYNRYN
ncbi:MAG TPA: hypothetical protein VJP40_09020 [bacterium]|nr:hypothetical protein [bacterium]